MPPTARGAPRRARRVTITDVAARAGVSPGAVSFALNDRPGVAAETRRRILEVATDLGWQPSHRARSLSRATSSTLGLVVARPTSTVAADPFFPAFVAGVNNVLSPLQQSLLFTVVPDHEAELATYRRLAGEQRVDGVILTDLRAADPRPALMAELGLPAITLGLPDAAGMHPAVGSVTTDDTAGVRELVDELIRLGHRRIAHVTGPDEYLHVRRRRAVWAQALSDAGLPLGICVHTDFSAGAGAQATERLWRERDTPTAIAYANDVMAIAGLAVLHRHGLAVPHDVSVTGFDGTELSQYVHPALTTVRTDVVGWGERAGTALLAVVDGGSVQHIELPPAIIVARESVAAPPSVTRKGKRP